MRQQKGTFYAVPVYLCWDAVADPSLCREYKCRGDVYVQVTSSFEPALACQDLVQ